MPNRFLTIALTVTALSVPAAAHAADVGGAIAGAVVGAAIATAVVPYEHRAPLREYVVRENRPSYVYSDEVVVGRELRPGPYEFIRCPSDMAFPITITPSSTIAR